MKRIDIVRNLFIESWELLSKNFSSLLPLFVTVVLLNFLTSWVGENYKSINTFVNLILNIILVIAEISLYYAVTKVALKLTDHQTVNLSNLGLITKEGLRYFLTSLAYFLLVVVGLILLIIPGIYFGLKYFFVSYLVVDKK